MYCEQKPSVSGWMVRFYCMQGIIIIRYSKYSASLCWFFKDGNAQTDKRLCSGLILIFASLLVGLKALVLKTNDISTSSFPKRNLHFNFGIPRKKIKWYALLFWIFFLLSRNEAYCLLGCTINSMNSEEKLVIGVMVNVFMLYSGRKSPASRDFRLE